MRAMNKQAFWIWYHEGRPQKKEMCFFRKEFSLESKLDQCIVHVSADSKYRFFVNDTAVLRGPRKGDRFRKYYDTVDIAPYLNVGINVISAWVVYFPEDYASSEVFDTGPISVVTTSRAGFYLKCMTAGWEHLSTDRSWRILRGNAVEFLPAKLAKYAGDMTKTDMKQWPSGFTGKDFDASAWQLAVVTGHDTYQINGVVNNWPLEEAPLPPLAEEVVRSVRIMRQSHAGLFSLDSDIVEIPVGGPYWVELDMGHMVTAYPCLELLCESEVQLELTYAESYFHKDENGCFKKQVRDDIHQGLFIGESDHIAARQGQQQYEPLFFRSFRFIRIDISYAAAPVKILLPKFLDTFFPVTFTSEFSAGPKWDRLWEISLRTLKYCMHDTYEDCPYYEQMQYTMDTSLAALYTYLVTNDDRLARQTLDAFAGSVMHNGLMPCNAPAKFLQVIPGFALYFIELVHFHYLYHGDKSVITRYISLVDGILGYFTRKINSQTGLVEHAGYWEFVDWVDQWIHRWGVPIDPEEPVNTIYNMMFIFFLHRAAGLNTAIGRHDTAKEYETLAASVTQAVKQHCYDEERKVFTDTTGRKDASMHGQFWAVLAGVLTGEAAREAMERCIGDETLFQCSYSMSFYLFRALEMVGMYEEVIKRLDIWQAMADLHLTTWPEDPVTQRSDCHGWSSLPIYEFCTKILGLQPAMPGYEKIIIEPYTACMDKAEGKICTPRGDVKIRWEKQDGRIQFAAEVPAGVPVTVLLGGVAKEFEHGGICIWEVKG